MVYVKRILYFFCLISFFTVFFVGCACCRYLIEQGVGQMQLQQRARPNEAVLKDPGVDPHHKQRIKMIRAGKEFFYSYLRLPPQKIYSRTTFLNHKAVSYLVIASPFNAITPKEFSFPIVGRFPYLGFFSEQSANLFQKELQREGYITWMRPVYAYSTLGYFEDTILSSFFEFPVPTMMETIFHELFHSHFFVENEVELNENLANYFGRELLFLYFHTPQKKQLEIKERLNNQEQIKLLIVQMINEFKKKWEQLPPATPLLAQAEMTHFLKNHFYPSILKRCNELRLTDESCFYLNEEWNQASFAAFMTYESQGSEIERLHHYLGVDLKEFYDYIKQRYDEYQKIRPTIAFGPFLLSPVVKKTEQHEDKYDAAYSLNRSP